MLVLTRKPGQSVRIGDDVTVEVVEVRGDQVRLGITAPPRVSILRREVFEEIQQENLLAAASSNEAIERAANVVSPLRRDSEP